MGCASMPYKVVHEDMALSVFYSNPLRNEAGPLLCDICNHSIDKSNSWVYYDHSHNFVTHFGCVADSVYGKGGNDDKDYIMGVKNGLTNVDGDDTCIVNYQYNEHEGAQLLVTPTTQFCTNARFVNFNFIHLVLLVQGD
ncbi:hypothetical protein HAX54_047769 [Datura stramonium]|uniref:Uncharacterized protein n=1 Tax=Datura stramonium TaxID=4076 RepID=A0ABS8WMG6_DATST|nr:hypothetical protein [Datura stramonium]